MKQSKWRLQGWMAQLGAKTLLDGLYGYGALQQQTQPWPPKFTFSPDIAEVDIQSGFDFAPIGLESLHQVPSFERMLIYLDKHNEYHEKSSPRNKWWAVFL